MPVPLIAASGSGRLSMVVNMERERERESSDVPLTANNVATTERGRTVAVATRMSGVQMRIVGELPIDVTLHVPIAPQQQQQQQQQQ
jgi:hypothetical protein